MRVLHINCNYIGTTLHQLMIEQLDSIGIENEVFVPTYDKDLSVINVNSNVHVEECFKKWDRVFFDYKQRKIVKAIEKLYDISSFDLIHAYTLFTDGNAARILSEKYHVPFVVAVRNTDVNAFFKNMKHLRSRGIGTMRKAKYVFFLSEAYRKTVFEKYVPKKFINELDKKIHIISNGIDDFWFENENIITEKKNLSKEVKLVYAGVIDKNKNIETTQSAIRILRADGINVKFTVVGKVKDKSVFERIVLDENTTVLPPASKDTLLDIYRSADIFVMPSFTESFGLVYVEAMSQGLPVIYSKGQGFDEQFPNGTVGYSVDAHSAQSVAEGIKCVLNEYDAIQSRVVSLARRFNWKEIVKYYYSLYCD